MPQFGPRVGPFTLRFGLARTNFAACRKTDDPALEHALADKATLCGIPERQVTVYRHLFVARRSGKCSDCRARAIDAPPPP